MSPSSDNLMLRALRREPVPRAPVWLMRQAGRYLPEYRAVRESAGGFLAMVQNPELAAEVTLQPIRRFGMDAAVLFSDILVPLQAMGMELVFDERGPVLPQPIRTRADVEALALVDPRESLAYVGQALELVREQLSDETTLLGFCGAPFTLASYAIEGGTSKTFSHLRTMMYRETETFELLLDRLVPLIADHLRFQVESGAQAVVLFDTWAASLTDEDYRRFAKPWSRRVLDEIEGLAPRIAFAGAADHLLEDLAALGPEGIAIDHRTPIREAFERTEERVAIQGNLDPMALFASPEEVVRRTRALLEQVGGRPGHILGLGHGVIKQTDPECVAAFVDTAKEVGR